MDIENRMKSRRLSHAYLIVGENRRILADRLAAAMVCTGEAPPCGTCPGCRKAGKGIHPDIRIYDEEGEGMKAAEVREMRSDAYILPNEAPRKVYLLTHGELLNTTGQNILLKLIEEGPPYAGFLFLSPNPEGLLPTIRSRCETLYAPGEGAAELTEEGERLAESILSGKPPEERLPLLLSLEKRSREEIALLLDELTARLAAALPRHPELMERMDALTPIRAACEFNISPGHLTGWLLSVL